MYRKSILSIKSISSSLSQVSPSPNSSPSSQNDLLNLIKTSPLIHLRRRRSSVAAAYAAQRSDFSPDSDPNGSYQQNPYGSDRRNPNEFSGEGAVRSYQSNPVGVDQGNSASLQQNLNGFNGGTSDVHQRRDLAGFRQSNSSDGYQRSNLGQAQQWSSNGLYREHPNGPFQNRVAEFQREGGRIGGQFNQMNNGQNSGTNGFYRENSRNSDADGNQIGNSFEAPWQSQTGVLSVRSEEDDDYPYESQVGFFRENRGEVHRDPTGHHGVNPRKVYQNYNGDQRKNLVPNAQQNLRDIKSNYETATLDVISETSTLRKNGGLYGGNRREVYQEPSGYYSVNQGQLGPNSYGFHRENPFPYGQQKLRDTKSNHESSTREPTEIREAINSQKSGGFYGGNCGEVYQDPSGYYGVNQGQLGPNAYGSHRENPLPYGQPNLSVSPAVNIGEFNSELSTGGSVDTGKIITYEGLLNKLEGFYKEGKLKEAFAFLSVFEKVGMPVDLPRYLLLVQACGDAKSLKRARVVHDHLSRTLGEVGVRVNNKVLGMYVKCGSMADAYQLFERMPQRNLTSWETMIRGLSDNGLGEEAIELFTEFKKMGLKPDGGLFNAIFYTCGVLEAADQGMLYFQSMKVDFGISPVMEHYISIVDMFGRSGFLNEALEFIEMMPIEPTTGVWESLMKFCRVNGYIELGDRCAEIVEQLDPSRVKQSEMVLLPTKASETTMEVEGKTPLDSKHQVREFTAGDRSHPENDIIYYHIRCLAQQMKEAGYVPNTTCTLHDVDIENKEEALLYHSERLATVHGLMTSRARMPLRIIKNLRVCRDCHNALKIISKLVGRLIVARDIKRFHHFENGVCSCNDYW